MLSLRKQSESKNAEVDSYAYFQFEEVVDDTIRSILESEFRAYVLVQSCHVDALGNNTTFNHLALLDSSWVCTSAVVMLTVVCCVSALGLVGNLVIILQWGSSKSSRFSLHVRYLAITDICNLAILLADSVFHYFEGCRKSVGISSAILLSYSHVVIWYSNNVVMTARHYQTFYFALDRYFAIRKPLHHRVESRVQRRIAVNVGLIVLFSALITIPQALRLHLLVCLDSMTILSMPSRLTFLRFSTPIIALLLQFTVPLTGSVVVTAMMSVNSHRQLRRTNDSLRSEIRVPTQRSSYSGMQRHFSCPAMRDCDTSVSPSVHKVQNTVLEQALHSMERMHRLNRSVFLLVAIFFVCELPVLIYFYVTVTMATPWRHFLIMLAAALSAVDSSVNYLAYRWSCSEGRVIGRRRLGGRSRTSLMHPSGHRSRFNSLTPSVVRLPSCNDHNRSDVNMHEIVLNDLKDSMRCSNRSSRTYLFNCQSDAVLAGLNSCGVVCKHSS